MKKIKEYFYSVERWMFDSAGECLYNITLSISEPNASDGSSTNASLVSSTNSTVLTPRSSTSLSGLPNMESSNNGSEDNPFEDADIIHVSFVFSQ